MPSRKLILPMIMSVLLANQAMAQDEDAETRVYVEDNVLAIFYHELGHALIDIMGVQIYGQEEDAADVLSILLIDNLHQPDVADQIATSTALGFMADVLERKEEGGVLPFWGVHGVSEQRYFNLVCLHYGGNVETRETFATDLNLPEERIAYCEDEREQADDAWNEVLDEIAHEGEPGDTIRYAAKVPSGSPFLEDINVLLENEIAELNKEMKLPETLQVMFEECNEANAFYDASERKIIMCHEFVDHVANHPWDNEPTDQ